MLKVSRWLEDLKVNVMESLLIIFLVIGIAVALNSIVKNAQQREKQKSPGIPDESPWDSLFSIPEHTERTETIRGSVFNYDEQTISDSGDIKRQPIQQASSDSFAAEEQEGRDEGSLLNDFDIKKAVIYSEILNPKFKEI